MTWTETQPVTFGKNFGLFNLYWNYCLQRRRQELNEIEFFTLTNWQVNGLKLNGIFKNSIGLVWQWRTIITIFLIQIIL